MHTENYIGRIGALAVTLGVGEQGVTVVDDTVENPGSAGTAESLPAGVRRAHPRAIKRRQPSLVDDGRRGEPLEMQFDVVPAGQFGADGGQHRRGTARVHGGAVRTVAEQLRRRRQPADIVRADRDAAAETRHLVDEWPRTVRRQARTDPKGVVYFDGPATTIGDTPHRDPMGRPAPRVTAQRVLPDQTAGQVHIDVGNRDATAATGARPTPPACRRRRPDRAPPRRGPPRSMRSGGHRRTARPSCAPHRTTPTFR